MKNTLVITTLGLLVSFNVIGNAFGMGKGPDLPAFLEVDKGEIYRGGQPTDQGFQQLAQMKINTVLDLRNEDDDQIRSEGKTVKSLGMNFISVPLSGILSPSDADMAYIESVLEDPGVRPLFVHCLHGEDRTGLAVGLYRVFHEKWAPKDAYQEMIQDGFHPILFGLNHYFEEKTGFED